MANQIPKEEELSSLGICHSAGLESSRHDVGYWYEDSLLIMTEHQSTFCPNLL